METSNVHCFLSMLLAAGILFYVERSIEAFCLLEKIKFSMLKIVQLGK